jgi:CHAD domain-containing protein
VSEREREIKLTARAPEALEELAGRPSVAGFALSSVETRDQRDVYLDTEKFLLFSAGYSLRYRRRSGILKATLKEIPGMEGRGILRDRREIEEALGEEGAPKGAVGEALASLAGDAPLLPILRLRTRRRVRKVMASGSAVAELCLDEVEVSPGGEDAEPLARFCEVEVEEAGEDSKVLAAVGEELLASRHFEPSLLSKLERGLDLLGLLEPRARRPSEELPIETPCFRLPEGLGAELLERRLASRFGTAPSPERVEAKTLHDSFDWRIHQSGGTYETTGGAAGRAHIWRDAEGRVRHRLRHAGDPGFPADLPPGALRDDLASVLSVRRLLPVVTLNARVRTVAVLDAEGKTTVRLHIESGTSSLPERAEIQDLEPRVRVAPLRGYEAERSRVAGFLREECGLLADAAGELEHALEPFDRAPGDYTSKFQLALDPAMPARDAARAIHLSLLDSLLRNEEGTRRNLDSEFLHDFRVSIRRTRSALTQIREVYPTLDVERFKEEFRWLGIATGPTRDLDVYLLKMGAYKEGLPEQVRADLKPLEEHLERKQKLAHGRLVAVLDSERYRRLVEQWRAFLTEAPAGSLLARNAERPVPGLASERIWRVYRRMVKRGRGIDDDTPAEALHDLRIRGKKLRYLLEFFRSLYPAEEIGRLVAELKRLQDNLGELNDYRVQMRSLQGFAAEMAEEGSAPVRTQLAMGRLLAHLDARRAAERSRFAKRFDRFASPENREIFARLFSPGDGP